MQTSAKLSLMLTKIYLYKSAVIDSDIFVLGGYDEKYNIFFWDVFHQEKKIIPVLFDLKYYFNEINKNEYHKN